MVRIYTPCGALPPDDGRTPAVRPAPTAYWSQTRKWESLDPTFAIKLRELLSLLALEYGWTAEIDNAWRPWSTQPAYRKSAGSKVRLSLHNLTDAQLRPQARAVDLRVKAPLSPEDQAEFFRDLREAAERVGLVSGGWYGIETHVREAPLSWDPPHVEMPGTSLSQMQRTMQSYYQRAGVPFPDDLPLTG